MDMRSIKEIRDETFNKLGLSEENSGVFYGKWEQFNKDSSIEVRSPIDGTYLGRVSVASESQYRSAIKAMEKEFTEWSETPAPKRALAIKALADGIKNKKELLGRIVSLEVGKVTTEGQGEIQEMIDIGYFATGLGRQVYGLTMASERPYHRLYEQYVPLGVIGVISAFNFPSSVWSWNAFIAATVGDTVVWKPSSKASLSSVAVMKVLDEIMTEENIPPIFALINGRGREIGELMAEDRAIKLISFTGSVKTGKHIAEKVSSRLGKTILELGGNNCAIVSEKADMKIALKGVAFGALATAGQRCTSTRRVVVNEKIYDEFKEKLKNIYEKARTGNPLEEGVIVGPMIDDDAVTNYEKAISKAIEQGGRVIVGNKVIERKKGYYVMPTIIEAKYGMEITKEETFAPILYMFKYSTMEEAMKIHNDVPQGLSSAIFTTDLREEEYFLSARGSDCGLANVNTSTAGAEIGGAFGGEKDTGGGRESGSDAWKSYMRRQTVTKNYGEDIPLAQGVQFNLE